ncbi:hypothetical protein DFH08DRAFT_906498 [Mycena albidolilacea]|uniref:Uncharacterized protein n=1 Tax=Mycena albidolilacea TaxID=1033008 RepID=A0AAD6YYH1_9AGAR|nr:hypothetical protein DFH08DRAFT_906498 [Mycena albidolilacea]
MPSFYIPPPGIFFRIVGSVNACSLACGDGYTVAWNGFPGDGPYESNWWQLVPTSTPDQYYIVNRKYNKKMYMRAVNDPNKPVVGQNLGPEETWPANLFKLLPHDTDPTKTRLIVPSNQSMLTAVYGDIKLHATALTTAIDWNQVVGFIYEDMDVVKVEYTLDQGKIMASTPTVLASQTLFNTTDIEQEMNYSMNETITETTSFSHTEGFSLTVGMSFSAGVPLFGESEFHMDLSVSTSMSWGKESSFQKSFTAEFPVKAAPHSSVRAVSTVHVGTLEVPYTMTLRSRRTGITVVSSGTWHGVSAWNLSHTTKLVPPGEVA